MSIAERLERLEKDNRNLRRFVYAAYAGDILVFVVLVIAFWKVVNALNQLIEAHNALVEVVESMSGTDLISLILRLLGL